MGLAPVAIFVLLIASPASVTAGALTEPPPVGSVVHPGAPLVSPVRCTVGFLVHHDDGRAGFLTAGHCVRDVGTTVSVASVESRQRHAGEAADAIVGIVTCDVWDGQCFARNHNAFWNASYGIRDGAMPVGTVEFKEQAGVGRDFALVVLFDEARASASAAVPTFGGPCAGTVPGYSVQNKPLAFRGNPGGGAPMERVGVGIASSDPGAFRFQAPVVVGDSGSPVLGLPSRAPVGIVTHGTSPTGLVPLIAFAQGAGQSYESMEAKLPGWHLSLDPAC